MANPNIILIILDTLREDHSHVIWKEIEDRGFHRYSNVIATASWTIPSHASMLTGLYPISHGAHSTKKIKADEVKLSKGGLITKDLKDMGYRNYLFSANPYISRYYGFRHFDDHYEILYHPQFKLISNTEWDHIRKIREIYGKVGKAAIHMLRKGDLKLLIKAGMDKIGIARIMDPIYKFTTRRIEKWPLDKGARKLIRKLKKVLRAKSGITPYFMLFNLMEVHEPYKENKLVRYEYNYNPREFENYMSQKIRRKILESYRDGVEYVSSFLEKLIEEIRKNGIWEDSLIIITSDHGQLLGESGKIGHGVFLHDDLLRVPLFIKYPENVKIRRMEKTDKKYISLKNLKRFILDIVGKDEVKEHLLYEDTVFAESYGINIKMDFDLELDLEEIEKWDRYRLAVYNNGVKGIFDPSKWDFEVLESEDGDEVGEMQKRKMRKLAVSFFKMGMNEGTLPGFI